MVQYSGNKIEKVTRTVRQKVGFVMKTFFTRRTDIMKQLWNTLIQCHIYYCSQLYMPGQTQGVHAIEKNILLFLI